MRKVRSIGRLTARRSFAAIAATAFSFASFALAGPPIKRLEDVQIGEKDDILRIAVICSSKCGMTPAEDGALLIEDVREELSVDLSGRSRLARWLRIEKTRGGSRLTVEPAAGRILAATIATCRSNSGPAPCVEFRFDQPAPVVATKARPTKKRGDPGKPLTSPPAPSLAIAVMPRLKPARLAVAAPALREAASFTPTPILGSAVMPAPASRSFDLKPFDTERLSPPPLAVQPEPSGKAAAAKVRLSPRADIRSEARRILGKTLDVGLCESAAAKLGADAWDLAAMVDQAFCKAADGKHDDADRDFARLLAYTPDNYSALVGRGLIARARGKEEAALAYFEAALEALPPIEESDRIVETMKRP